MRILGVAHVPVHTGRWTTGVRSRETATTGKHDIAEVRAFRRLCRIMRVMHPTAAESPIIDMVRAHSWGDTRSHPYWALDNRRAREENGGGRSR